MAVNPAEIMEKELQKWARLMKDLEDTLSSGNDPQNDHDDTMHRLQTFHEWLSGIPGIDEATALSSAITHIESNKYDIIVFDTAPTGHTLKLLGMPQILQKGVDKLQSWQSTLWNYWEVIKGFTSSGGKSVVKKRVDARESIAKLLSDYKANIQKVACMLADQNRRYSIYCGLYCRVSFHFGNAAVVG
jgi:arsenite-transporting ATPase